MIYIITDTHWNHTDQMIAYCGRPKDYNELLWRSLEELKDDDMLIHLGDICIGKDQQVHDRLKEFKFKKILVKGNHDHKSSSWYRKNGWDFVCKEFKDTLFGKNILFSHKPRPWDGEYDINIHGHFHNSLPRLLAGEWKVDGEKERNEQDLVSYLDKGEHKLLALEYEGYKPIKLDKFINN